MTWPQGHRELQEDPGRSSENLRSLYLGQIGPVGQRCRGPKRSNLRTRSGNTSRRICQRRLHSKDAVPTDRFDLALQNKPAAQGHDAPQFAFVGKAAKQTHCCPLTEATNYNFPRVNAGIHLCRDKLIDIGYSAQHAVFIFVRRKVEALDVEPTQSDRLGQIIGSNNLFS